MEAAAVLRGAWEASRTKLSAPAYASQAVPWGDRAALQLDTLDLGPWAGSVPTAASEVLRFASVILGRQEEAARPVVGATSRGGELPGGPLGFQVRTVRTYDGQDQFGRQLVDGLPAPHPPEASTMKTPPFHLD